MSWIRCLFDIIDMILYDIEGEDVENYTTHERR